MSDQDLDQIAEEFVQEMRKGANPSLEDYLQRYEDPDGELAQLLSSIAMIESLKNDPLRPAAASRSTIKVLDEIDDYRILREVGRGGMGVVYEAIHRSLERRVAIKVLSPHLWNDPKHLNRFRREARAAARLRHPNIVPVFAVGSTEDHHYYVMDLIEGHSLSRHIRITRNTGFHLPSSLYGDSGSLSLGEEGANAEEPTALLPPQEEPSASSQLSPLHAASPSKHADSKHADSEGAPPNDSIMTDPIQAAEHQTCSVASRLGKDYWHWVASLGNRVCSALQYAHDHGVLHRDIKPGNLILDQAGEIWIADFGLAKLAEQMDVTGTGEVLGTPQYLPPESLNGQYDEASEVYAVGLTLYELLTLRPAIDGKNAAETLRNAGRGVTRSLRLVNARIPRDLETVVMKCLAFQPEHRYRSAAELGLDLERFANGQPITARRAGILERIYRWTRREPSLALASAAAFLLTVLLTIVSSVAYFRTSEALHKERSANRAARAASTRANRELSAKLEALDLADQQRLRAESNLQTALKAFDEIIQEIVDRSLEIDSEFFGEPSDTVASNVSEEDAQTLRSLLVFFDELATNNSSELIYESAKAAHIAGDIYVSLGQLSQSRSPYLAAANRYRRLCELDPMNAEYLESALDLQNDLLTIYSLTGQLPRAHTLFQQIEDQYLASEIAMEGQETRFLYAKACRLHASLEFRPDFIANLRIVARAANSRGYSRRRNQQLLEENQKAERILNELVEPVGSPTRYHVELARCLRNMARIYFEQGQTADGLLALDRAINTLEELVRNRPGSASLRYELAMTLVSSRATSAVSSERFKQASSIAKELLKENPELPRYRALSALTKEMLGNWESSQGNYRVAEAFLWQAINTYSDLLFESPEAKSYQMRRVQALADVAKIKVARKDIAGARELLERALNRNGTRPSGRRELTATQRRLQERLETQLKSLDK